MNKRMTLFWGVLLSFVFIFQGCTSSTTNEKTVHKGADAKTDAYYSEEEMNNASVLIVKVKKTDREINEINQLDASRYYGWTISDVEIVEVFKNSLNVDIQPAQSIRVLEQQFSYYDKQAKETQVWHVNQYNKMIPGNEYILYLKYSEDDKWYMPLAVVFGKINLDANESILYSGLGESNEQLMLLQQLRKEVLARYG